ncbi:cell division protein FtsL [Bacillus cereus]|nr:cell division protein FtsL [Bacillus cereus]
MLYVIGFLVISIVAIRLNMRYYKVKGNLEDIVTRVNK